MKQMSICRMSGTSIRMLGGDGQLFSAKTMVYFSFKRKRTSARFLVSAWRCNCSLSSPWDITVHCHRRSPSKHPQDPCVAEACFPDDTGQFLYCLARQGLWKNSLIPPLIDEEQKSKYSRSRFLQSVGQH